MLRLLCMPHGYPHCRVVVRPRAAPWHHHLGSKLVWGSMACGLRVHARYIAKLAPSAAPRSSRAASRIARPPLLWRVLPPGLPAGLEAAMTAAAEECPAG